MNFAYQIFYLFFLLDNGIPDNIMSDNGLQFSEHEAKQFAMKFKFRHLTTNPHYCHFNALVENHVEIIKQQQKRTVQSDCEPYLAQLNYRRA